ncbi:MAG: EAL domain-containing protein [Betaproteobacteria bacterium]|nr:EAL domain-containing protein [Betaproteobacteria bacterium]
MSAELDEEIREARKDVVMSTLATTVVAGGILLAGHLVRNLQLGNSLSVIHPLLYGLLILIYLQRERIGAARIAWLNVALLYIAATVGLFLYGLLGNSAAIYMGFCFVAANLFGKRGGMAAVAVTLTTIAGAGTLLLSGRIALQTDPATFIANPFSWLAAIVTAGAIAWLVLNQVDALHTRFLKLLAEQHHLARHDALTGLANRSALESILEQAIALARRDRASVGVILLDLDRFKTINDSLGHNVGDRLLVEVAGRIRNCMREADVVARLGGDEFVVVIPRLDSPDVTTVATRIVEYLSLPYMIDGRELRTPPSLGIAIYPEDAEDVETLMRYADTAMYSAKDLGGGCFRYFSPDMNTAATKRLHIETELRGSLIAGHIEVHYQPKVDLSGRITGLEALARWRMGNEVAIDPAVFIAIAEETTLINELGDWVLGAVCRQIRDWQSAGITPPRVAVNLSARQLKLADLAGRISRALADAEVPARLLEVEITETAAMESIEKAERLLGELSRMGLTISLDDFGTGYSSLANLRSLPIDALKLDKAFVHDIAIDANDLAIARGTIALAHSLGLRVIAEGVESAAQWSLLTDLGCDEIQGYLIARPAPATSLVAALRAGRIAVPAADSSPFPTPGAQSENRP